MVTTALDRHIEIVPEIADGKPRIADHRITVQDVVLWNARNGDGLPHAKEQRRKEEGGEEEVMISEDGKFGSPRECLCASYPITQFE